MKILLLQVLLAGAAAQERVNSNASTLQEFTNRVAEYSKLHNKVKSGLPKLKATESPDDIANYERQFARGIRDARRDAEQGNIFKPPIAAEFRRLVGMTMKGPEAVRIRESLRHAEPVNLKSLLVNQSYPDSFPLQSTPPTLLIDLPHLPPELEYRVVGRHLILRDVSANLVVDYIPNLIR